MTSGGPKPYADAELIRRKLSHQLRQLHGLLDALTANGDEPYAFVVETYSRGKVEAAAQQALRGHQLPQKHAECDLCGRLLSSNERIRLRGRRSVETLVWYLDGLACEACDIGLLPKAESMDVLATALLSEAADREPRIAEVDVYESSGVLYRPAGTQTAETERPDS